MKNVALALASGGPRGFAYIGAIEVLQERGYRITSVAGTSAGALVGGIFAAGGMEPFKEWLFGLDTMKVMTLIDFTVSKNYLVKGDKVMDAIRKRVPEVNIEDLDLPFAAVATDLHTGEEVVFREGPLFEAIRASISIPSMFRPVRWKGRTLVDGGMVNTFPLNRVERTPGDILVGFNVNQIDAVEIRNYLDSKAAFSQNEAAIRQEAKTLIQDTLGADRSKILKQVRKAGSQGGKLIRERINAEIREHRLDVASREGWIPVDADDNFKTILQRSFGIMNCTIARMGIALNPPDILIDLPFDSYHGVYGYTHAREIVEMGRQLTEEALDRYESA